MEIGESPDGTTPTIKNRYGTSKQEILKAAEALFAKQGFASTTLRDVAASSGANTALVGYYFGSKEGLRKAVADLQIEKFNRIFNEILTNENAVSVETFKSMIRTFLEFLRTDQLIHRLRLWSINNGGEFAQQMAQSLWTPFSKQFATVLMRLNPTLNEPQAKLLSVFLGGLLQQYADFRWVYSGVLDLDLEPETLLKDYEDMLFAEVVRVATTPRQ